MSKSKLKVFSIVGTRPEIIRLAAVIKRLEAHLDHRMIHTGQNYDYTLNQIFFDDLGLRAPDYFLGVDTSTLPVISNERMRELFPLVHSGDKAARDEFIGNAKREAEALRKNAEEQARAMVEEQEIVRVAKAKSTEMLSSAEAKSKELRRVASQYVDDIIRQTVESLNGALATVQTAQNSFRSLGVQPQPKPQEKTGDAENILPVTSNIIIEQRRSDE